MRALISGFFLILFLVLAPPLNVAYSACGAELCPAEPYNSQCCSFGSCDVEIACSSGGGFPICNAGDYYTGCSY